MLISQQLTLLGYVYDGMLQGEPQWDVRWHVEPPLPVSITTVMVVIATVMSVSIRMQDGTLKTSPVLFIGILSVVSVLSVHHFCIEFLVNETKFLELETSVNLLAPETNLLQFWIIHYAKCLFWRAYSCSARRKACMTKCKVVLLLISI